MLLEAQFRRNSGGASEDMQAKRRRAEISLGNGTPPNPKVLLGRRFCSLEGAPAPAKSSCFLSKQGHGVGFPALLNDYRNKDLQKHCRFQSSCSSFWAELLLELPAAKDASQTNVKNRSLTGKLNPQHPKSPKLLGNAIQGAGASSKGACDSS